MQTQLCLAGAQTATPRFFIERRVARTVASTQPSVLGSAVAKVSAGASVAILAAVALYGTTLVANSVSASRMIALVQDAAAPGLSLDETRRLLIIGSTLALLTGVIWLVLAILKPTRGASDGQGVRRPRRLTPSSWVQRHRGSIVLAAGVAPVLLAGLLPLAATLLPLGLHVDASSAVGTTLLDWVIGLAVPGVLLSVLYFRWVARLSRVATDATDRADAAPYSPERRVAGSTRGIQRVAATNDFFAAAS
jgi:hypothetical protein